MRKTQVFVFEALLYYCVYLLFWALLFGVFGGFYSGLKKASLELEASSECARLASLFNAYSVFGREFAGKDGVEWENRANALSGRVSDFGLYGRTLRVDYAAFSGGLRSAECGLLHEWRMESVVNYSSGESTRFFEPVTFFRFKEVLEG